MLKISGAKLAPPPVTDDEKAPAPGAATAAPDEGSPVDDGEAGGDTQTPDPTGGGQSDVAMLPKKVVVYMTSQFGPFRCDNCCYFTQGGTCELVEGTIDPGGCCNLYCPPNHDELDKQDANGDDNSAPPPSPDDSVDNSDETPPLPPTLPQ